MHTFDLIVIGSGPGGQRAAIQAAKLRKRVAICEKRAEVGGVCINTGTIPSKTLREAVIDLSGLRQHTVYGESFRPNREIRVDDLLFRAEHVMRAERDVIRAQLQRNGVTIINGIARFVGTHDVVVDTGVNLLRLHAPNVVIAVGSAPGVPAGLTVDHSTVLTSDDILALPRLPRTMTVVGAGIIGVEYATMFAALGVDVTLVDKRNELLDMVDREIVDAFTYEARQLGVILRLGEEVARLETNGHGHALVVMKSGKRFATDLVMISAGRQGATNDLGLEKVGVGADTRGRIQVNEHFETSVPGIYAVGDVIGAPSLASTSSEQGRLAACHIFGIEETSIPELYPFGIYAIPEVAWVGSHEAYLTKQGIPYETGVARYKEIARGQILGDVNGMLKLIFHLDTRKILGVWALGTHGTELVHIGQAVMALGGTLDYFVQSVFNYPTLAECYKVAALDGFNKLRELSAATAIYPGLMGPELQESGDATMPLERRRRSPQPRVARPSNRLRSPAFKHPEPLALVRGQGGEPALDRHDDVQRDARGDGARCAARAGVLVARRPAGGVLRSPAGARPHVASILPPVDQPLTLAVPDGRILGSDGHTEGLR
jgi:NAD(P) transhydrogenase